MKKKVFFPIILGFLAMLAPLVYLHSLGATALLTLSRKTTIEVNGTGVRGELLQGRLTGIVTIREPGKAHSYRLFFEGDTDFLGDTGFVIDCHAWVAPRFPILIETFHYPPCNILSEDVYKDRRWPVFRRGNFIEFVTSDRSIIRIGQPNSTQHSNSRPTN